MATSAEDNPAKDADSNRFVMSCPEISACISRVPRLLIMPCSNRCAEIL